MKDSVDFAIQWCSRLIKLPKDQSIKQPLELIKNYFTSIKEVPQLNTARTKLINDVYQKLLAIHKSSTISDKTLSDALRLASSKIEKTAQIISKLEEKSDAKPDRDLLIALSSFYSCFGSVFLTIPYSYSYIEAIETMSKEKRDLLSELLTTARDDLIMELIEKNIPYDRYFNEDTSVYQAVGQHGRNDSTETMSSIIRRIQKGFKLPSKWLVQFLNCDSKTHVQYDTTTANLLRKYIQNCEKDSRKRSVSDFVIYAGLKCTADEEYFCILFESYAKKVLLGTIGYIDEQIVSV